MRAAAAALCLWGTPVLAQSSDVIAKGKVLFAVGGCANCHTDTKRKGPLAAGGAALKTPFGAFYAPNITPDKDHGIGAWSDDDFIRAMRDGIAPDGSHYFPVFPYPSFTNMTDDDMRALKAYIFTLPPVAQADRPHDVGFPFNLRFGQIFWKWLFFDRGPYKADDTKSAQWNRGAYLSRAVAHCGECHTPRNFLGGLDHSQWFVGAEEGKGPEGEAVPNIRSDDGNGIRAWSMEQIEIYLESGEDPEGDYAGSLMFDVVDMGTDQLSNADRSAISTYLKALPPIR
ncbi:MAG: c-type cytochrome [Rhodospirillaceae bacterium]|mgnify:CR=1 FL=1|jgi:mono/diheme cytochrome c family protein|nr:c-type cytochrome [Rhodospirillaceae bacterium]MBT5458172.1 c-type cytochrome [Rhodospirillaceae bacterium]